MTVKTGVVYLQKDKFQLYSPLVGRVFEFRFVPEIIRDLDVINKETLENYIKVFVTNSKLAPSNLVFVLSDTAYFVKDFVLPAPSKTPAASQSVTMEVLQKQADEFIEHVPFDNVVSKTLPLKDGMRIIATNKDFYESIAVAFEHLGFTTESVLPGLVLGNGISLRPVMDPTMASVMLQKANAARQYDLLGQQVYQPVARQESEEVDEVELDRLQQQSSKKMDSKKIFMLVGVGVVLIALILVLYQQLTAPPPDWRKNAANNPPPAAASASQTNAAPAAQAAAPSASSSAVSAGTITVQIVSSNTSASVAQSLLARLDTYKFKSVTSQTQQSVGSAATLVSFSTAVSPDVRTAILTEVKKFEGNVIVQEKQIGSFDVTIVLGQ